MSRETDDILLQEPKLLLKRTGPEREKERRRLEGRLGLAERTGSTMRAERAERAERAATGVLVPAVR